MKKLFLIPVVIVSAYIIYIILSLVLLPPVSDLKDKNASITIHVKDWHGRFHPFVVGPENRYWVSYERIPSAMKWSVILGEDSNFYNNEGIDVKAMAQAAKYDFKKKSMAKGASTITQQLAKNLYLSRKKTITRKLMELYLAVRLDQELTKDRTMELYLNLVELGPMVYGIGHASQYYFNKPASALTPRESAFLAAMLPGPRVAYNPYRNMAKVLKRSNMILRALRNKGVITPSEYQIAIAESPNIAGLQKKVDTSLTVEKPEVFPNISGATDDSKPADKIEEVNPKSNNDQPEEPPPSKDNADSEHSNPSDDNSQPGQ
ncbi:MAG: transglycosylase domain-containing protein [Desulfuromonadales bacterium]|nr:transglycosylase domain-containing protein [Desulfuromonadales bacterium]